MGGLIISDKVLVWTKQNKGILKVLDENGRYIVKEEYIKKELEDVAHFSLDIYSWYTAKAEKMVEKPSDVKYPVWVSLSNESTFIGDSGSVTLEIEIEKSRLIIIDIEKWGNISNYFYLPKDGADKKAHKELLEMYGVDDARAYMSNFYPVIRNKIIESWDRLFEDNGSSANSAKIGTIWEVKKEWIVRSL